MTPKHIVESQQFTQEFLDDLFSLTASYKNQLAQDNVVQDRLKGKVAFSIFFEESTRTRFSFETAASRLGMQIIGSESAGMFSSIAKGESIEDMMIVLNGYLPAVAIIRTNQEGLIKKAAAVSPKVPIINAGDGKGQHPTQSLIDLFTIKENLKRVSDLNVTLGGDLRHGRTVRSLVYLLSKYQGNQFTFISPASFALSDDIKKFLKDNKVNYTEQTEITDSIADADVIYWTRTQLEKGADKFAEEIVLDESVAKKLKKEAIILHPLPRVKEITTDVDKYTQAKYFEQAHNGLPLRMALLDMVI